MSRWRQPAGGLLSVPDGWSSRQRLQATGAGEHDLVEFVEVDHHASAMRYLMRVPSLNLRVRVLGWTLT